jgi:hypothetical protein
LSKIQSASPQSPPEHGQQSMIRAVGISRHHLSAGFLIYDELAQV